MAMNFALAAALLWAAAPASARTGAAPSGETMPHSADEYLLLAQAMHRDANDEEALKVLHEGMAAHPEAQGFHLAIGNILLDREEDAHAFYEYQWELLRAGDDRPSGQAAARACAEILRAPRVAPMILGLVDALKKLHDHPAQARDALAMLASNNDDFVLQLYLAEATMAAGGDAEPLYRKLIERDPYFVPAYVELAEVLHAAGKDKEAQALVARARKIDPDHWRLKNPADIK